MAAADQRFGATERTRRCIRNHVGGLPVLAAVVVIWHRRTVGRSLQKRSASHAQRWRDTEREDCANNSVKYLGVKIASGVQWE
jgi:hypothetical protein